jgi:single-stranded-DNA-specific exonuclease
MVMRKSPRIGFQRLCKVARVNQRFITEDDVGFMIAPRVNAASRMGEAWDAFQLFTTTDEAEADTLAKKLEALNRSRRAVAGATTKAVHERLEKRKLQGELPSVIVMGDPEWRPGLLGLVANGIAEEYSRPVFLWGREGNETLKGSCRAGGKTSVNELMHAAEDAFIEFGGHAASGGFSIAPENIFDLEAKLVEALATLPSHTEDEAKADARLTPSEVSTRLLSSLDRFAPFGMKNQKPVFALADVLLKEVSWFGKSGEHLRVMIQKDEFDEGVIEAICFYATRELGKESLTLEAGTRAHLLAHLERNQFSRVSPVRLRILELR